MTEKELDMILNTCLNDAMCKVDRIKQPNSNKISEFITNWMKVKKLNIDDVSKYVLLAKNCYRAKDGSIKEGILLDGKFYAPKNDC